MCTRVEAYEVFRRNYREVQEVREAKTFDVELELVLPMVEGRPCRLTGNQGIKRRACLELNFVELLKARGWWRCPILQFSGRRVGDAGP